jgi:Mor family transcriptional regulator
LRANISDVKPLDLDRAAIFRDRQSGQSLSQLAKGHRASRATIHRVLQEETKMPPGNAVSKGLEISVA